MRKIYPYIFLLLLVLHAGTVYSGETVTLDYLLHEACNKNPEILSTKKSFESASARIPQAGALSNPSIEYEYDKMTADRQLSGDPMKTWGISQEIPFPTKLYYRAKIASKLAKMAYENYKTKERKVVSEVKNTFAELYLIHKSIEISKESKALLEQMSATATTRYSAGQGTQSDVLKAHVEIAKIENELIMLEQKRQTTEARLNILINSPPDKELGVPVSEELVSTQEPIDNFYNIAKENSPELRAYRYAIQRGKAAYELSIHEFMPDFMFQYKRMVMDGRLDSENWAAMVGVTVPLWFFQKEAFGVKEMKAELEMLEADYVMKENEILYQIKDAHSRLEANRKLIELYETSFIPQADETFKASLKGYESGSGDFITLLDSQRMLIEFKLDHYKAIVDLRIAFADLERVCGKDFSAR